MIFSDSNKEIAPALTKAWGEIENPKHNSSVTVKTKSGGQYTFDYTDLGGIFEEAKRVFKENSISVIQNAYTSIAEGQKIVSVETMLLHSSGEWVKSNPLQFKANDSIQDMGGQVTYMKRYSLSAMLGIATEKDDDANGASGNDYSHQTKTASDKQLNFVNKLLGDVSKSKNITKDEAYATLKKRLNTTKELEEFSPSDASNAIKYLQGVIEQK